MKGKVVEGEEPKREGGGCCGGSPPPPPDPLKFHLKAWDNTCGRNLDLDRLQVGASSESEDDPELEEVRARYMTDAQLREPGGPLEKVEALVGIVLRGRWKGGENECIWGLKVHSVGGNIVVVMIVPIHPNIDLLVHPLCRFSPVFPGSR